MKKGNIVIGLAIAGSIVLVAVLSLIAQDFKPAAEPAASAVQTTPVAPTPPVEKEPPPLAQALAEAAKTTNAPAVSAGDGGAKAAVVPTTAPAKTPAPATVPSTPPPLGAIVTPGTATIVGDETSEMPPKEEQVAVPSGYNMQTNRDNMNLISIALDEVPLMDVVRMFTKISQANIIATATNLQGTVTVSIQDVEWKPALNSILSMHNLQLLETAPGSQIYTIVPKVMGQPEPLVVKTIPLSYASASNIITILSPLVDAKAGENVSSFSSRNMLVVRATAAKVLDIEKVVRSLDLPRQQVFIEAKFMELNDQAMKAIGLDWQVLEKYGVGVGSVNMAISETRTTTKKQDNAYKLTDERTRGDTLRSYYDKDNNLISAPAADASAVAASSAGGSGSGREIVDTINKGMNVKTDQGLIKENILKDVRTAVLSADAFRLILSALQTLDGASIVSNPKIIVANEETASIHIGEREPNIKGTTTKSDKQGEGNTTTYGLDPSERYFDYGVTVEVTPTVNDGSNISVRINPTLSRFVKDKTAPDGTTFPVTATKTIRTIFSLESGKTAAIGGLTETSDRKVEKKVPLLGDIPLLGKYLFSHNYTQKVQKETIIFVTVGLANPRQMETNVGLPDDADLIHRYQIHQGVQKLRDEAEIRKLRADFDMQQEKANKPKKP